MLKKLNAMRNTESGLFNIWEEFESCGRGQRKTVTKYNFHKWCILKVVKFDTDRDVFN